MLVALSFLDSGSQRAQGVIRRLPGADFEYRLSGNGNLDSHCLHLRLYRPHVSCFNDLPLYVCRRVLYQTFEQSITPSIFLSDAPIPVLPAPTLVMSSRPPPLSSGLAGLIHWQILKQSDVASTAGTE